MKIDKVYFFLAVITIASIYFWISSCVHDLGIPAGTPEICFDSEVLPIFQNNCDISGCHGGGGRSRMDLSSYAGIYNEVTPGHPDQSRVYLAIIGKGDNLMPPGNPLPIESRTIVRLWILQGAAHTTCPTTPQDTTPVPPVTGAKHACYTRDIMPILVSNCAKTGCHDAASHRSGYNFADYAHTLLAVTPGNYSTSRLYTAISGGGEDIMPPSPDPQLSTAQIDSIAAWITYGALNETCAVACDTTSTVTFSGMIWPFMQTTCTGCHTGASPSGGVSLANYSDVSAAATSGLLTEALTGTNGKFLMPPSGSLSKCTLRQFEMWINAGAPNN